MENSNVLNHESNSRKATQVFNTEIINEELDTSSKPRSPFYDEMPQVRQSPELYLAPDTLSTIEHEDFEINSPKSSRDDTEAQGIEELKDTILQANKQELRSVTPARSYLDTTVVPALLDGLKALVAQRPANPLTFLGNYLLEREMTAQRSTPTDLAEVKKTTQQSFMYSQEPASTHFPTGGTTDNENE
ncbi:uncharacterized protein VTP21DRAFT_10429 [Calcarisporiella thermophila]|uniref:uncharacterized protein n=1 Tax=Calcarisporiella thermophila TaxID=911321 RepID=UPI0037448142